MGVGAIAVGVLAAGASIYSANKSASATKDAARTAMSTQERIAFDAQQSAKSTGEQVRADQSLSQRNLLASEQARLNIMSSLGTPGSYGPTPGATSGPIQFQGLTPTGLGGLTNETGALTSSSTEQMAGGTGSNAWQSSGTVLDADKMTAAVTGTSGFRQVSQMVAEAEQLMNRTGPLWNQLNNSVVGGIYESNAGFQREAMEQLSRHLARGGGARRVGLQMAQAFQVQEKINRQRTGQLWQAKMGLEQYRIQHSKDTMSYAQQWVSNQAGIRDAFTNATQNLQLFWASTMAPTLAGSTVAAASATQQGVLDAGAGIQNSINTKSQAIGGAIEGITGAAQAYIGQYSTSTASGAGSWSSGSNISIPGGTSNAQNQFMAP